MSNHYKQDLARLRHIAETGERTYMGRGCISDKEYEEAMDSMWTRR